MAAARVNRVIAPLRLELCPSETAHKLHASHTHEARCAEDGAALITKLKRLEPVLHDADRGTTSTEELDAIKLEIDADQEKFYADCFTYVAKSTAGASDIPHGDDDDDNLTGLEALERELGITPPTGADGRVTSHVGHLEGDLELEAFERSIGTQPGFTAQAPSHAAAPPPRTLGSAPSFRVSLCSPSMRTTRLVRLKNDEMVRAIASVFTATYAALAMRRAGYNDTARRELDGAA